MFNFSWTIFDVDESSLSWVCWAAFIHLLESIFNTSDMLSDWRFLKNSNVMISCDKLNEIYSFFSKRSTINLRWPKISMSWIHLRTRVVKNVHLWKNSNTITNHTWWLAMEELEQVRIEKFAWMNFHHSNCIIREAKREKSLTKIWPWRIWMNDIT